MTNASEAENKVMCEALSETDKKAVNVLVIGSRHEFQRHQDTEENREKVRAAFDQRLRQVIKERNISLIAEEAGDDKAVWESLKREEDDVGEFAEAFGGGRTVESPVPTIAKKIADEHKLKHVDVRADDALKLSVEERDATMTAKILEARRTAESVLVIVGEDHRAGVVQRLKNEGLSVVSFRFP